MIWCVNGLEECPWEIAQRSCSVLVRAAILRTEGDDLACERAGRVPIGDCPEILFGACTGCNIAHRGSSVWERMEVYDKMLCNLAHHEHRKHAEIVCLMHGVHCPKLSKRF